MKEEDKKEGILKRLENIKDKNEELLNAFSSKSRKNKVNNQSKNLIYNSQHGFAKFKNIDEFKGLSLLESLHKKLKNFHTKITSLKNVPARTKDNEDKKKRSIEQCRKPL